MARLLGRRPEDLERQAEGTTSSVFALRSPAVVLIVAPPGTASHRLAGRLELARVLSARAPVVRPWDGIPEPVHVEGRLVTVWERVPVRPGAPDWAALGRALRALHEVRPAEVAGAGLGDIEDLRGVETEVRQLRAAGRLRREGCRVLLTVAGRLDDELAGQQAAGEASGAVVLHGDLHRGNLLSTPSGVVLCDLDEVALGDRDHDLGFLVDPGRPTLPAGAARQSFQEGYARALPSGDRARTVARLAHLRRTVRLLQQPQGSLRARYYGRLRLASWARMSRDWSLDLQPVVAQPRQQQLLSLLASAPRRR